MNKQYGFSQTTAIITALILVIGVGVAWAVVQNNNQTPATVMMEEKMSPNESDAMMNDKPSDAMTAGDDKMMADSVPAGDGMTKDDKMASDKMMQKAGSYKDYSASTVEAEQKAGNKVVLFFHASWCPFCKSANEAFSSRSNEIPAGVVILKTDYDSNTALRQKYGVTYQHTFVQIDNDENQVSKWNGGDIDNLKKYLK